MRNVETDMNDDIREGEAIGSFGGIDWSLSRQEKIDRFEKHIYDVDERLDEEMARKIARALIEAGYFQK